MSKPSFAEVMKAAGNGRRRASQFVCLSPDLADRYTDLQAQFESAIEREAAPPQDGAINTGRRLSGNVGPSSNDLQDQMATLIAENPTAFYELQFEQKTRDEWLALRSQHSPRDGVEEDAGLFNSETFPVESVRASLVDPEPTDEVMDFLSETLSFGEWDRIATTIWFLNEGARQVPKSALA